MADTRKDKRAPVSLKVRFKSATVDEFIEHYSKDVSRGGIYIKSSNPMAVGTLLKFQFQLKDESALIKGVGRVVWTRNEVDATADSPAGMGIKFIKMDNDSRAMVERIVDMNAPDPGSYVSGRANATSAEPTSSAPPPSTGGGNFFPDLPPAELPPPEDRTAVRHATQFLANALKEGTDEVAAAEAALKAEEAKRRQDEVEAQRKAEAEAAKKAEEEAKEAAPPAPSTEDEEAAPKSPLPSMIIDPSLEPRAGRPSEVARETDVTPLPRTVAAIAKASDEDASEPDTEPPPPPEKPEDATPTTSIPASSAPPKRSALPIVAILVVLGIAAWVALRGGPEETPVEEPAQPAAIAPEPEPAKVEPAPEPEEPAAAVEEPTPDAAAAIAEEKPVAGAEVPRITVEVQATPREAEIFVDGEKKGEGTASVELPVGSASTVSARAKGFLEATHTANPVAGKKLAAIKLKLKPLPYIVHVETTPPGAAINVAGVKGITPADLTLDKAPTQELSVTAKLDGYERALTRIPPSAFSEASDGMRSELNLTLKAKLPEEPKEVTPPAPAPKKPGKKPTPKANVPTTKPVEGGSEPPKSEEPTATPPPPADEPKPEPKEEKPAEALPGNPFGN